MSSLSAILNTAGSAIQTYQAAINVTGQNISNVDNKDYSIQTLEYRPAVPMSSGGQIYGTGVNVEAVTQEVNQILENQLTAQLSARSALEQEQVYMTLIEDLFSDNSTNSLNTLMDDYWRAWESLSNTPAVDTEQKQVYATGQALAQRITQIDQELEGILEDLDREIGTGISQVNTLTADLAGLNQAILAAEHSGASANDLKDRRNALVDDLGNLMDIDLTVKQDGSYLIMTCGGLPLVEDHQSRSLENQEGRVCWCGTSGTVHDITDKISGGAMAGWLEIRDAQVPQVRAQLDELASSLIWTMNFQHAQGAGQAYFQPPLEGTYAAGDSRVLASLTHGDQLNYEKDYSMVIQNSSSAQSRFQTVLVDMGLSRAGITDFQGTGRADSTYELTVVDPGVLGDQTMAQTLTGGGMVAAGSVADALDAALGEQVLTITDSTDTRTVRISDSGGDARRSAARIAGELDSIDGLAAYASPTELEFSLAGLTQAQEGDLVRFTLYVDGQTQEVSFTVDPSDGSLADQFEAALAEAAQKINQANQNTDLRVDGCAIQSAAGATIGIQDFAVTDNTGVALSDFQDFDANDTLTLTVATDAIPPDQVEVQVDLAVIDTTDSGQVAQAFYQAMDQAFGDAPFTAELDKATGQVILRTTDGSGVVLSSATGDTGSNAGILVTALGTATAVGDGRLEFNGTDTQTIVPDTRTQDYLGVALPGCQSDGAAPGACLVGEDGGSHDRAAVLTGSVTLVMDPGVTVTSSDTSLTGIFGPGGRAEPGNSMITLGGTKGFEGIDPGDTLTFTVDGQTVSYTATDPGTGLTDTEQASQLSDALTAALPPEAYQVIQNGTQVTIVRTAEADAPIAVTGFTDQTGGDATLALSTGTGTGVPAPATPRLVSGDPLKDSAAAQTWGDPAVVFWEIFDRTGQAIGQSGYLEIDGPGTVTIGDIPGTGLSFEVSQGSLVAGNTLRVNTDRNGCPDPPDISARGTANSLDDTYEFTVLSGGTLPDHQEPLVIGWTSETGSGTLVIEGRDNPDQPVFAAVDGMTLELTSGTLVKGDVFYLATDASGRPGTAGAGNAGTVQTLSDWHWTLDSFADEFNRTAGGVQARVTDQNTLVFDAAPDYCPMENIRYTNAWGINEANTRITVLNHTALDTAVQDLTFSRSDSGWEIQNDPTGGTMQLMPEGGDDDGFMVDLDGDGFGDIQVRFDQPVSGNGAIQMDLASPGTGNFSFAFAGDEDGDSGLAAALGVNTFFTGTDAATIGINSILENTDYIASGMADPITGTISSAGNANALAMANTRYQTLAMKQWCYARGESPGITVSQASLDEYQVTLSSTVGLAAQGIQTALSYSDQMVYQLTGQRDAISAVSLDEEMIRLTAQQQAYTAAAKLLTAVDEMFDALLAIQ